MEIFKTFLFGITGVSVIFWVCVIALWHTYMFPRLFSEDRLTTLDYSTTTKGLVPSSSDNELTLTKGAIRPKLDSDSLLDRSMYSRKSFVLADFNPVDEGYSTNRLYTLVLLSLGIMSFLMISYGLRSSIAAYI